MSIARSILERGTGSVVLLYANRDDRSVIFAAGLRALAERFGDRLPAEGSELHAQQIGWAREQAESLTEYFVKLGRIDPADPIDGRWPIR